MRLEDAVKGMVRVSFQALWGRQGGHTSGDSGMRGKQSREAQPPLNQQANHKASHPDLLTSPLLTGEVKYR